MSGGPTVRVIHTEFQSADAEATSGFLSSMFSLAGRQSEMPAGGTLFDFLTAAKTGLSVRNAAAHERGPGTTVYLETDDMDATLEQAVKHGAKVVIPKMTFAQRGVIAWIEAPGGVYMAFMKHDETVTTTGEAP